MKIDLWSSSHRILGVPRLQTSNLDSLVQSIESSSHRSIDSLVVERSAAEAAAYKSGRGFPPETLRAVRVGPRMVLKNNDNDKVLLILFKGVPPQPPTSQQPAAGGARKSMKKQ